MYTKLVKLNEIVNEALPSTLDPRDIYTPGAWVTATRVDDMMLTMGGSFDLKINADIYIIVADSGIPVVLPKLEELTIKAIQVLAARGVSIDEVTLDEGVVLPNLSGGAPLPSYKISVTY